MTQEGLRQTRGGETASNPWLILIKGSPRDCRLIAAGWVIRNGFEVEATTDVAARFERRVGDSVVGRVGGVEINHRGAGHGRSKVDAVPDESVIDVTCR